MKRSYILLPLLVMCSVLLAGCVTRAEYDKLEERVGELESYVGYTPNDQSGEQNSENTKQPELSTYITNWDEVVDTIYEILGRSDVEIIENSYQDDAATIKNFGNGTYYVTANDVTFFVSVTDYKAEYVAYNNGSYSTRAYIES